ncbi:MAG: hypothetical protein B6D37_03065 [Sphingobacteriales bacterium UTBCD1]|jgi:cellulose synthase/poly-beta-1,6-N-acetylglucosamine synthase-like glycosyltransferase|nr:MAG: hypothetical protein B6D37_03065 [Sphingobacteriales bacterium UTBCD1]
MATNIFWISLFLLTYCYTGYAGFLFLFNKFRRIFNKKSFSENNEETPSVTLIVAVYNESAILEKKIQNTFAIKYPKDKLELIFVDDGSTDDSSAIIANYPEIGLIYHNSRKGKAAALQSAMKQVRTPVVIFCDANSILNDQCIQKIVPHYNHPLIGGVAGEKKVLGQAAGSAVGEMEGFYWKYESFLKRQEADFFTTVGAAGELFSIRTSLFRMTEVDIITDDFLISMQVCLQGYRIAYEPGAYSTETPSASIREETKRKVRIAAGAYQSIGYSKGLFNFIRHPLLSFQYFSHRLLRWVLCPFLLPILLVSNMIIVWASDNELYRLFLYGQLLFYLMAAAGWLLIRSGRKGKIVTAPFYFVFMNTCLVRGLFIFLNEKHTVLWQKAMRTEASGATD